MLIPTGAAIALALVLRQRHVGFRNSAGYGLIASTIGFVFVSVGGAGLIANLTKNIIGRARPKLFDQVGALDFKLFAFEPDYASLPSGHATNIFAFATVIGMLWPRGQGAALHRRRLDRGEPGPDRPALRHRRRARRHPRDGCSLFRAGPVCRPPVAVRAHARGRLSHPRGPDPALARLAPTIAAGGGEAFRPQWRKFAGRGQVLTLAPPDSAAIDRL